MILFAVVDSFITHRWIYRVTMDDATEQPAFILLLLQNAVMLLVLWLGGFVLHYAKVRIVLEARTSAVLAIWAGIRYIVCYWRITMSVALLLAGVSLVLMVAVGAFLESVHVSTAWMIAVVFIVQQSYLFMRLGLSAMSYASAVEVFRTNPAKDAYPLRIEM
jgi:hypothetical protein